MDISYEYLFPLIAFSDYHVRHNPINNYDACPKHAHAKKEMLNATPVIVVRVFVFSLFFLLCWNDLSKAVV